MENIFEELIHFAWGFTLKYRWGENHLIFSIFFPQTPFHQLLFVIIKKSETHTQTPELSFLGVASSIEAVVCRCVWRNVSVRISTYPARGCLNFVF